MSQAIEDDQAISARMRRVRERGHLDAYELKLGVDRLSDWREHVRSHPLPAFAASAVIGFLTTRAVFPSPQPPKKVVRKGDKAKGDKAKNEEPVSENEVAAKAGITSAIAAMAGTMLMNAAKQYVTYQVQNRFRGKQS